MQRTMLIAAILLFIPNLASGAAECHCDGGYYSGFICYPTGVLCYWKCQGGSNNNGLCLPPGNGGCPNVCRGGKK